MRYTRQQQNESSFTRFLLFIAWTHTRWHALALLLLVSLCYLVSFFGISVDFSMHEGEMLQQIRRKCYICWRFWFILLTKPISWIIIHNWKRGKSTATWKKTKIELVWHWKCKRIYREIENKIAEKSAANLSAHTDNSIASTVTWWNFARDINTRWCTAQAFISVFFRGIGKHIVLMYAREASGICNIVSKFKTSNYWFEKEASFYFFDFFSLPASFPPVSDSKCCPRLRIR